MSCRGLSKAAILALAFSGWLITAGTTRVGAQDSQSDPAPDREARDRGRRSRDGGPEDRAGGLNRRFDDDSPGIGELLPEITAYDADGKTIHLRPPLKGHYSVIVFGCLT